MEDKAALFEKLLGRVSYFLKGPSARDDKLQAVCCLLKDNVPYYDWVGFYLVDQGGENLVLGPYAGQPTEHVKIPFGRGICGQAAAQKKIILIQDVSKEENYLSCSLDVRSEIVVPIFKNSEIVGQIDIDSHSLSPFSEQDRDFLEKVCHGVSVLFS